MAILMRWQLIPGVAFLAVAGSWLFSDVSLVQQIAAMLGYGLLALLFLVPNLGQWGLIGLTGAGVVFMVVGPGHHFIGGMLVLPILILVVSRSWKQLQAKVMEPA